MKAQEAESETSTRSLLIRARIRRPDRQQPLSYAPGDERESFCAAVRWESANRQSQDEVDTLRLPMDLKIADPSFPHRLVGDCIVDQRSDANRGEVLMAFPHQGISPVRTNRVVIGGYVVPSLAAHEAATPDPALVSSDSDNVKRFKTLVVMYRAKVTLEVPLRVL